MLKVIGKIWHRVLVFLHLSPLSLAEKCRIAFGSAVVLILGLALLLPYVWMGKLTVKSYLDSSSAKSEVLFERHFSLHVSGQGLSPLSPSGEVMDPNRPYINWVNFNKPEVGRIDLFTERQMEIVESLKKDSTKDSEIYFEEDRGVLYSNYVKVFRANDNCITCHNPQGSASPFGKNEPVGAAVIKREANVLNKTSLMNLVWIIIAGLIGGVGAIVAFYIITQRVILRPIRQLRAMANNVAEGNLDIRSSIQTRDEYEKLAQAFNHMLDNLQSSQKKLRDTNRQLDDKIVELSERNIELFRANKIKSEFLANMSHEFRTPLNAILGFADIIKDKPGVINEDKGKRYAENIITGGKRLLNMINDLLDLAKSEAGKLQVRIGKVCVQELCREVTLGFAALTQKKRIKVKTVIDEDIPLLNTDGDKVQQILYNFFSNAVKFTPEEGRIVLKAEMTDDKHVLIEVTDTGPGIPEEYQDAIFEKFRQADGSLTRTTDGTGLGLAISKELTALLAGKIGMQSEVDKGTTFYIEIPVTLKKEEREGEEEEGQ